LMIAMATPLMTATPTRIRQAAALKSLRISALGWVFGMSTSYHLRRSAASPRSGSSPRSARSALSGAGRTGQPLGRQAEPASARQRGWGGRPAPLLPRRRRPPRPRLSAALVGEAQQWGTAPLFRRGRFPPCPPHGLRALARHQDVDFAGKLATPAPC